MQPLKKERNARTIPPMRKSGYLFSAVLLLGLCTARGLDCDDFHKCTIGAIRDKILNFHSPDKDHPLNRALRLYRPSLICPDAEITAKQKEVFSENELIHDFGSQCSSSFSFTAAEAVIAHMLLIFNAAFATAYVQKYD